MMKFLIRIRSSLVIWTGGGVILLDSILPEAVGSETDSDSYFRGLPDAVVSIGAITVAIEIFKKFSKL